MKKKYAGYALIAVGVLEYLYNSGNSTVTGNATLASVAQTLGGSVGGSNTIAYVLIGGGAYLVWKG